jgi:hypothetical protein
MGMRVISIGMSAALALGMVAMAAPAGASDVAARLYAGPGYMSTDTKGGSSDASGVALLTQLDAGVQLLPVLQLHATLIYDYSSWLEVENLINEYPGSMLGFGVGATLALVGFRVGASVGGQLTYFTSADDPSSGATGAGLGPLVAAHVGYVLPLAFDTGIGLHVLARYRSSPDETGSIVYDPRGYQIGLALSIGLDGEPLLGF